MLLTFLLLACTPDAVHADSGGDDGPLVTASASLVESSPTTVRVGWLTEVGEDEAHVVDAARLHATSDAGDVVELALDPDAGQALVWALHPDADVQITVEVQVDGTWSASDPVEIRTGSPPTWLPSLEAIGDDPMPGQLLLTTFVTNPSVAVLIDGQGVPRWWRETPPLPQLSRVRVAPEGDRLLAMGVNPNATIAQALVELPLGGGQIAPVDADGVHHDFWVHDDGTIATLVHDERTYDGLVEFGDRLIEVSPDGATRTVFDAWDHWTPDDRVSDQVGIGWSHANALTWDASNDSYLVSFYGLKCIARVDRQTGALMEVIGAPLGTDYTLPDGSPLELDGTHGMHAVDGGLLLFENDATDQGSSRGLELRLNADTGVAELLRAHEAVPNLYSVTLGDTVRLDSGNTLVVWSVNGWMEAVDPGGDVVWRLAADLGGAFGYVTPIADPTWGG